MDKSGDFFWLNVGMSAGVAVAYWALGSVPLLIFMCLVTINIMNGGKSE